MKLLVVRQPVFDANEKIFAYDLMLRAPDGSADVVSIAPEQLVADVFLEIGLDRVANGHRVLVTIDPDMLLRGTVPLLPADRVIIQLQAAEGSATELVSI